MKKIFLNIFLLFCFFGFSQEYDLSLQLEVKKSYPQKITSEIYSQTTQNNQVFEISTQLKSDIIFQIQRKESNIFHTQASYSDTEMEATIKVNGKENRFIENNKPLIKEAIKNIVNEPFSIHFNTKGKVTKIPIMDGIFDKSIRNVAKNHSKKQPISDFQQKAILEQLQQSFGGQTLISNLETFMAILPKNPVKTGDSWQISSFLSKDTNIKVTSEYTLEEVTSEYILIKGKSDINLENERITLNQGQQIALTAKGEITSELRLDPKTKWIISAHYSQTMKGQNQAFGDRSHPEGIIVPFESISKISIDNQ